MKCSLTTQKEVADSKREISQVMVHLILGLSSRDRRCPYTWADWEVINRRSIMTPVSEKGKGEHLSVFLRRSFNFFLFLYGLRKV